MSRMTFVLLLTLGVVAIAAWLILKPPATPITEQTAGIEQTQETDYYLIGATTTEFTSEGDLRYRFSAAKIEHYPQANYSLVDAPSMLTFQSNGSPWLLTAKQARVNQNNEEVRLWENVVMNRQLETEPLHITTSELWVEPQKNIIRTDKPIQATQPGSQIQATGMMANLDKNLINLLSKVNIVHDPHYPL